MSEKIFSVEGHKTVNHESSHKDLDTALSILTALMVKGKEPDEVFAALALAAAVFNTIAAPDEAKRDENTASTERFWRTAQSHMWKDRDELEVILRERVTKMQSMMSLRRAMAV